jgi:cytochrome o ubiquinol oxidase subunit 3
MIHHPSTSSGQADKTIFGFWVYLMSDCVLFATLFATFAVLQHSSFGGVELYDLANLPFVFGETLILLTSSFTVGLSLVAAHAKKKNLSLVLLLITLLLGLTFLGMEMHEFAKLIAEGSGPSESAFLSSFFALVGTHGLHVFLGSIWMAVLILRTLKHGFTESNLRKLTLLSLFWHFLDVIWIFIFTLVYLFGALAI